MLLVGRLTSSHFNADDTRVTKFTASWATLGSQRGRAPSFKGAVTFCGLVNTLKLLSKPNIELFFPSFYTTTVRLSYFKGTTFPPHYEASLWPRGKKVRKYALNLKDTRTILVPAAAPTRTLPTCPPPALSAPPFTTPCTPICRKYSR